MARHARPDRGWSPVKVQLDQPRVAQEPFDRGRQRPELESLAWRESRRRRPVFRPRVEVARAEDDGDKTPNVIRGERPPAREPHFDGLTTGPVDPAKARGDG